MTKTDLNWIDVDTTTFKGPLKTAYVAKQAQDKVSKEKRTAFENALIAAARAAGHLENGKTFAFGYRFGKLTVAVTDEKKAKAKASAKDAIAF